MVGFWFLSLRERLGEGIDKFFNESEVEAIASFPHLTAPGGRGTLGRIAVQSRAHLESDLVDHFRARRYGGTGADGDDALAVDHDDGVGSGRVADAVDDPVRHEGHGFGGGLYAK